MTGARALLGHRRLWPLPAAGVIAAGALAVSSPGAGAKQGMSPAPSAPAAAAAQIGGPAPRAMLALELPLVANDAGLARFADAVSTPGSPLYGHFASVAALTARFGARPGVAGAVQRYLRRAGARDVAFDTVGQYVSATMTVAAAQRTFGVRLARFRDAHGVQYIAPATGLAHASSAQTLPSGLRGLVTGVVGLDTENLVTPAVAPAITAGARLRGTSAFARRATAGAHAAAGQPHSAYLPRSGSAAGCRGARRTGSFTPNQYLTAYGYRGLHNSGLQGQGMRVALIEIDGFKGSDINGFARCFRLPYPHVSVRPVGGLRHPLAPGGEATLDLELLTAAAPRLSQVYVYESAGTAGHVLRAYSAALARQRHPQVISISLGICESLAKNSMGQVGIDGVERILRTAAASGVSLLASAGDQGSSSCVRNGRIVPQLAVSYPASSSYVTGVGGTNFLLDGANHILGEIAWNDTDVAADAGGGGISTLFGPPSWQAGFHQSGRIVPDVSMLADLAPGYAIFCTVRGPACRGRGWTGEGGTSAAAPLLAGGIALVDQDLRRHHRPALGDLNPLWYLIGNSAARGLVYNDITRYGNDLGPYLPGGTGQPLGCCTAVAGYDGATGWGSVNVSALARLLAPGR